MARKKLVKDMSDVVDALAAFRSAEATIRADYMARAEGEISKRRQDVLDLLFVKHAGSGPSEIANSTGLSRSTVIRWRKEFLESAGEIAEPTEEAPVEREYPGSLDDEGFSFSKERDTDQNVHYHVIVNHALGQKVYVVWDDVYAEGENAEDLTTIDRPDWLTDEIIEQAEESLGFPVPGKKR